MTRETRETEFMRVTGRVVSAFALSEDGERADIHFRDGTRLDLVLAGVCSRSYFHDAAQFRPLIGATIRSIEERELGEVENPESECTRAHCLVFITDRGHETIDWRNDSNGYYDGYVVANFEGDGRA